METIINFLPSWVNILIVICFITSALNPLVYFLKYEYKKRGEFIKKNGQRPTVKDFWEDFNDEVSPCWWIPITDVFVFGYGLLYLIFYPFNKWWKVFVDLIKNIKI